MIGYQVLNGLINHCNIEAEDETVIKHFVKVCCKFFNHTAMVGYSILASGRQGESKSVSMTYSDLFQLSCKIADDIRKKNVKSDYVGISIERSIEYIVTIFGCWLAGKGFVPLGYDLPAERRQYIINESGVDLIIGNEEYTEAINVKQFAFDDGHRYLKSAPAYIIFSSGTTGKPKGVVVNQSNLFNLYKCQVSSFKLRSTDLRDGERQFVHLFYHSVHFDASVSEILTTLLSGNILAVVNETAMQMSMHIQEVIAKYKVSHLDIAPSLLKLMRPEDYALDVLRKKANDSNYQGLKTIVIGGESADVATVRKWAGKVNLVDVYGPTEATVCTSLCKCTEKWCRPLIGKPIDGVEYYIKDARGLHPVQKYHGGCVLDGELWIAGQCLAVGYLNDQKLTNEKFVNCQNKRYYRTGDHVRAVKGGIEFIGRLDRQIKLHGQLVELDEVEFILRKMLYVKEAAAMKVADSENEHLVSYIVLNDDTVSDEKIRTDLNVYLPKWMIPAKFIRTMELPKTASGKIAYAQLQSNRVDFNFRGLSKNTMDSMDYLIMVSQSEENGMMKTNKELEPFWKDAHLDTDNCQIDIKQKDLRKDSVFFTGATGFLGAYALHHLLTYYKDIGHVYCLVRCNDEREGLKRIEDTFKRYDIDETCNLHRLTVLPGDLSKDYLGLPEPVYDALSREIGVIFHCAAAVNMLDTFEMLAEANMIATENVLKFAMNYKRKILGYASTLSVFVSTNHNTGVAYENEDISKFEEIYGGYAQTKFVDELLLHKYEKYCYTKCFRFGLLTGSHRTARGSSKDFLSMFVRGAKKVGCLPVDDYIIAKRLAVDITPVDYAAEAMVTLTMSDNSSCMHPIHVANERPLGYWHFVQLLEKYGIALKSYGAWTKCLNSWGNDPEVQALRLSLCRLDDQLFKQYRFMDLFQATDIQFDMHNLKKQLPNMKYTSSWNDDLINRYIENAFNP